MQRFLNPVRSFARHAAAIPNLVVDDLTHATQRGHVHKISQHLNTTGIVKVTLQFQDPNSNYLHTLIQNLHRNHGHGLPISHSASRGWFWDIRPTAQTGNHLARSETMCNFPWHTDCSYEASPPRFFALQVIQHDRCGGGTLSVLDVSSLGRMLSTQVTAALRKPEFRITTPPEFMKEDLQGSIVGSLLSGRGGAPLRVRFREDIVTPLTAEAAEALEEMRYVLTELQTRGEAMDLTSGYLPSGSILLIDNYRWLHMRNEARDKDRHLRRVRWNALRFV